MNAMVGRRARAARASLLLVLGLAACRVNPTSPDLESSEAGKACPPDAKIEDAEDSNNQILVQDGRSGYLYTYADGAGTSIDPPAGGVFTTSPGGANGSQYALRMSGQIGNGSGVRAAMGLNFADPRGPYDASKYKGISFYARKGPSTTGKVLVKVPDKNTDPDGGVCAICSNDFGMKLTLSEEWQKFIVPFSALRQDPGWGNPKPRTVDSNALFAIHFQVSDTGRPFDVWVDDMAFTGCP
jgi:endoglucanase